MGRKGVRNTRYKVKNRSRDIDQVWEDVKEENVDRRLAEATEINEDLPGMGKYFCVSCSKYFVDQLTLDVHRSSKPHKRRLKTLEETPHSQDDADRAAGLTKEDPHLTTKRRRTHPVPLPSVAESVPSTEPAYVFAE
ncbi:Bud site selection protein 20 [Fasciola hepatica]|uniref:Bud site selection protein 20 n=1 Tax=Fasciola hepatica TaxID=6192 RepID=A0A2H1BV27_FASHE|nr:Bud site selection protein 20 [Fasciola hepatica]